MWTVKKYQFLAPLRRFCEETNLSERVLAQKAKMARSCFRQLLLPRGNFTIEKLADAAESLGARVTVLIAKESGFSEYCTVATAMKIAADGFDSWKIHLMNLVDEFRRTHDPKLLLLAPPTSTDRRIAALMASTVLELSNEAECEAPSWAQTRIDLERPWFVAGMESLKASALVESPTAFRQNNIYVGSNFLKRA
jgi:hypothetical protein